MSSNTQEHISCSVANCRLKSNTIFSSPQDPMKLNTWRRLLRIPDKKFYVCENHFEEKFVKKVKLSLKPDAVPTLFISHYNIVKDDICQSCLKDIPALTSLSTTTNFHFCYITDGFKDIFREVVGIKVS